MAATLSKEDQELRDLLKVVSPDTIQFVNALIYGDVGAGKTFLGGTADDDERTRPLLVFDIEGGLTTLKDRTEVDTIPIRSVKEVESNYNKLHASIKADGSLYYKTVMIDSGPELADLDLKEIMGEAYSRNPDKIDKDVPDQRGWGKGRAHMRAIVRAFRDLPCNVIITAQVGILQEEGQPTKFFPGFAGKLRTEIPGFMDIVGYLYTENNGGVVERKLQVEGTRRIVAKDRTSALGGVVLNPTIPMLWDLIHNPRAIHMEATPASLPEGG